MKAFRFPKQIAWGSIRAYNVTEPLRVGASKVTWPFEPLVQRAQRRIRLNGSGRSLIGQPSWSAYGKG